MTSRAPTTCLTEPMWLYQRVLMRADETPSPTADAIERMFERLKDFKYLPPIDTGVLDADEVRPNRGLEPEDTCFMNEDKDAGLVVMRERAAKYIKENPEAETNFRYFGVDWRVHKTFRRDFDGYSELTIRAVRRRCRSALLSRICTHSPPSAGPPLRRTS